MTLHSKPQVVSALIVGAITLANLIFMPNWPMKILGWSLIMILISTPAADILERGVTKLLGEDPPNRSDE